MSTNLPTWSTLHLSVVQIGVHLGVGIEEPSIDPLGDLGSIIIASSDVPGQGVIQHRVGKTLEVPNVVDDAITVVELAVLLNIVALLPD